MHSGPRKHWAKCAFLRYGFPFPFSTQKCSQSANLREPRKMSKKGRFFPMFFWPFCGGKLWGIALQLVVSTGFKPKQAQTIQVAFRFDSPHLHHQRFQMGEVGENPALEIPSKQGVPRFAMGHGELSQTPRIGHPRPATLFWPDKRRAPARRIFLNVYAPPALNPPRRMVRFIIHPSRAKERSCARMHTHHKIKNADGLVRRKTSRRKEYDARKNTGAVRERR